MKAAKSCATTRHGTGTARGIRTKRNQLNKNGVVPKPDQPWKTSRRQVFNLLAVQGNQDVKEKKAKRKKETTSGEFSEKHESERISKGRDYLSKTWK